MAEHLPCQLEVQFLAPNNKDQILAAHLSPSVVTLKLLKDYERDPTGKGAAIIEQRKV